jgi:hypothetical protein
MVIARLDVPITSFQRCRPQGHGGIGLGFNLPRLPTPVPSCLERISMGSQPESKLSRAIMAAMRSRGAFVWKNHGGPTMMTGLPDITGVYQGLFVAVETKMPEGKEPTPAQRLRHAQIWDAGGSIIVARSVADVTAWMDRIDDGSATGARVPRTTAKTSQRPSQGPLRR